MKAISTVIATLLMLMMVIALAGTAYLYISGVFTSRTATTFELIDASNNEVTIRNSGTDPITSFSSVKIDGSDAVYRVSSQDSSVVGYWSLNEGVGTTASDSSGYGNTGALTNGPTWTSGKFGNALNFDGSDDYVDMGNPASLRMVNDFTVGLWLKASTSQNAFYDPISHGHSENTGWVFQANGATMGVHMMPTGSPAFTKDLRDNAWHYLVAVKSSVAGTTLYLDGVVDKTLSSATGNVVLEGIQPVNIGRDPTTGNGRAFNGIIDEVKIYNRALSESEVKASYDIGSQINPGEMATIKIYNPLAKGTHTLRLCTSSMCNTGILTIT